MPGIDRSRWPSSLQVVVEEVGPVWVHARLATAAAVRQGTVCVSSLDTTGMESLGELTDGGANSDMIVDGCALANASRDSE